MTQYVKVPVEPTPEMIEAARDVKRQRLLRAAAELKRGAQPDTIGMAMTVTEEWAAMLAARPQEQPAQPAAQAVEPAVQASLKRTLLRTTTNPQAVEPVAVDYDALIRAAWARHKYRQGSGACIAFKHGAEWQAEQTTAQPRAAQAVEPAEFAQWLNTKRDLPVAEVFHEIVAAFNAQPQAAQAVEPQTAPQRLTPFDAVARAMDMASLLAGAVAMSDTDKADAYAARLRSHLIEYIYPAAATAQPQAQPLVPLTDEQALRCIRTVVHGSTLRLTRDVGPYEVTELTPDARRLIDALITEARGIGTEGGAR